MDLFPDGAHVRLRSRVHGEYLHADVDGERTEEVYPLRFIIFQSDVPRPTFPFPVRNVPGTWLVWVGVSTSSRRASLSAAWAAHSIARGGAAYVLLRNAAYGRYLALWSPPAPRGQVGGGRRPVLRAYDDPEQDDVLWVAVRAAEDEDEGDGSVLLRHGRDDTSFVGVTADSDDSRRTHWVVEAIPPRQRPPFLPAPVPLSRPMVLWRTIAYVRADDEGNFDPHPLARRRFIFYGRSVFQLKGVLSILLREWFFGIELCVRAGSQGRLTPLVIDLPANEEAMDIVVLTAGSPAVQGQELVHPDVDA